jgi:hypothetical protein
MHGLRETGVSELRPSTRVGTHQEILDNLRTLLVSEVSEVTPAAASAPAAPAAPSGWGALVIDIYRKYLPLSTE